MKLLGGGGGGGGLQLVFGRPTLALSSALVPQTLPQSVADCASLSIVLRVFSTIASNISSETARPRAF